tara:strand:+ start:1476 stop:3290 length:1815 start_codon:yes stop_codon:yes gene_type:complete
MKLKQTKLLPYIFLIFFVFFTTYIWDKIEISFPDIDIIGIYSKNNHNSLNDILRYLTFISLPVLSWLVTFLILNKKKINKFIYNFRNTEFIDDKANSNLYLSFFLIFFFLLLDFLSLNLPTQELDLVHEGQQLSSAFRSSLDNSLWSNSYVIVGIFFETINAKLSWNFFNDISIGGFRISILVYILILKILFLIFVFKITNILNLETNLKPIFFLINSFIFINFLDYDTFTSNHISYREIPILVSLILIVDFFNNNKNKIFVIPILFFLSFPVLMWSLDRGIVYNIILISLIFFILIKKDYKNLIYSIIFITTSWYISFLILGDEFYYFLENSKNIIFQMNYIHGIIHPQPFSDDLNSTRSTKTLILLIINFVISIKLFFNSNFKISNNFKFVLFYISLVSLMTYLYALGRSDGPHIKETFAYPLIFQALFLLNLFFILIGKSISNIFNKSKNLIIFLLLIFISLNFNYNLENLKTYNSRIKNFVKLDDKNFLKENELELIDKISSELNDKNCIQLFSNDVALLYLLRKKSCSKFYFTWSIGTFENQRKVISELNQNNLIISGGPSYGWDLDINEKLPILSEYINDNYELLIKVNNYQILQKKN